MAKQTLLWTVVPFGRVPDGEEFEGQWRVSVVVSPRLTPQAQNEQTLSAFPAWLDWPGTLGAARFSLSLGASSSPLQLLGQPDTALWKKLLGPDTPVEGFKFTDMSTMNWYSYSVRNVLGFLRRHYGELALESADEHPRLLPWSQVNPELKGMLADLGTRTEKIYFGRRTIEQMTPGFSRFFRERTEKAIRESVFDGEGLYDVPVTATDAETGDLPGPAGTVPARAMAPDWSDPQNGGPDAGVMQQFRSADEYTFYQADRFYRREERSHERYPSFQNIESPPDIPEFDFHRIIASYANYPVLQRRLGLVMDFALEEGEVIDAAVAAGNGEGVGQCRLKIDWEGNAPGEDARPRSAWLARKDRFVPRPRTPGMDAGLLRLEHSGDGWNVEPREQRGLFDIYQVDPDGAALKTVNYTLTAQNLLQRSLDPERKHGAVTYTTGDRQPPAALRSAGLGVSLHGRAQTVIANAGSAELKKQAIESGNDENVVLFAEDMQRGFRVDVANVPDQNEASPWKSLCQRSGEWRLVIQDEVLDNMPDDEGYLSGASTTSSGRDKDHYLNETLFRWHGWSLVAERPGRTLVPQTGEDDQLQAEVPTDVDDVVETGNGIAVKFKPVKGTLPRLRFGQLYRLRARTVDLAGNSLALDDPSIQPLEQASEAVGYWRFEPVDPPVLVNRSRLSEGESLERMVIRSDHDKDAGAYLASSGFSGAAAGPESVDFEYTPENERHVAPPKSSQQQCETHGLFDPFYANWDDIKKGYEIAAREAGSLFDETDGAQVELVVPGAVADVATSDTLPIALPDANNPVGDRTTGGQYVIHREARMETPWLPDGAAGGIAIRAITGHELPGVTGPGSLGDGCEVLQAPNGELVLQVPHGGDWPYRDGLRLVLAERLQGHDELPCSVNFTDDGAPHWNPDDRVLTFFVPKGHVVRLRYASYVDKGYVDDFGIPRWAGSEEAQDWVMGMAVFGVHWMITPFRKLTLVHAVQKPVCLPELEHFSVSRQLGDPHADLRCRIVRLHGPSTGKFEIEAEWDEWTDDINEDGPRWVTSRGQLGEVRLAENHVNEFHLEAAVDEQMADPEGHRGDRHIFGDMRFRLVRYRIRASTRFREYLPPPLYEDPDNISRVGPVATGPGFDLADPADPGAPVLRSSSGNTGQSVVPASTAPRDPRVMYVVPTFRWSEPTGPGEPFDVTRLGNGLRVWLDRPWFSSGDGELLGVVLFGENTPFEDVESAFQPLVSQWGTDPLWKSSWPRLAARVTDFTAAVTNESVHLQEQPDGPPARIIGHRVHWDPDRALWYCDVEIEPGQAYMPFVRLALVRYQPNALPSVRVSKVVLADFAQTLPRRRLRVQKEDDKLKISLYGPNPAEGPLRWDRDSAFQDHSPANPVKELGRNRVEVVLQEQEDGIESELGWKDVTVLAEHVVGDQRRRPDIGVSPGPGIDIVSSRIGDGRTVVRRAGGRVELPGTVERARVPGLRLPIDPAFWSATVTLPDGAGKRRLQVREFERFYSDNTVPERTDFGLKPRRVIEERLVFVDNVPVKTN